MRSLKSMIGEVLVARIPALDRQSMVIVKLLKVENTGIWIESQAFTERMLARFRAVASPNTLVLFIPFEQIEFIVNSADIPCFSEKALGF